VEELLKQIEDPLDRIAVIAAFIVAADHLDDILLESYGTIAVERIRKYAAELESK
jgi:hypothetical protein